MAFGVVGSGGIIPGGAHCTLVNRLTAVHSFIVLDGPWLAQHLPVPRTVMSVSTSCPGLIRRERSKRVDLTVGDQGSVLAPQRCNHVYDTCFEQGLPQCAMTRVFQALKGRIASNAALAAERYGPVIGGQVYTAVSAGIDNGALPCPRSTSLIETGKVSLLPVHTGYVRGASHKHVSGPTE